MKGVWSRVNFYILLKTSFLLISVLSGGLCLNVSISVVCFCVNSTETMMQLVVLVAAGVMVSRCAQLVLIIILIIWFSHVREVWTTSAVSAGWFVATGLICCIGHYGYR